MRAAHIALSTVKRFLNGERHEVCHFWSCVHVMGLKSETTLYLQLRKVIFCCYSTSDFARYKNLAVSAF